MVQNFDWEIVQKIIKYASEWLKMVENGLKHLKMAQNVSNAWKWINITEMGEMAEAHKIVRLKKKIVKIWMTQLGWLKVLEPLELTYRSCSLPPPRNS